MRTFETQKYTELNTNVLCSTEMYRKVKVALAENNVEFADLSRSDTGSMIIVFREKTDIDYKKIKAILEEYELLSTCRVLADEVDYRL